jgi:triacylglycerol lipase
LKPAQKPLPSNLSLEVQRQLLFQPESNPTHYEPFEGASDYPFEPDAAAHSRVNAWWLAEAAWLSYWRDKDAVSRVFLERTGLTCDLIAIAGAECYVAASPGFAIVTFRGTQADDWSDIFDDVRFATRKWDAGHVHEGFARRLETVRTELERLLNGLQPGCRVWFTGHSLGAAVATLAAYRYRQVAGGVYTFGSPLVGNGVFAGTFGGDFDARSMRYTNDHDIVTRVPPEPFALPHGLYSHVDHLRWINKEGQVGTTQPTLPHFVRDVFGRTNVILDLVQMHRPGLQLSLPDALADHTPLYYVLHCWNDFALHHE